MKFTIENRTFEEVAPYHGELLFVTDERKSLIGVTFDKSNNPCAHYKEGPVYFRGLPTSIEVAFLKNVKKRYPTGFHS